MLWFLCYYFFILYLSKTSSVNLVEKDSNSLPLGSLNGFHFKGFCARWREGEGGQRRVLCVCVCDPEWWWCEGSGGADVQLRDCVKLLGEVTESLCSVTTDPV